MIEQGTVVEVRDGKAVVEMAHSGSCDRCRVCAVGGGGRMRIEVDAPEGIVAGTPVEVDVPVGRLSAALTVYLIPLGALLLGAMLGNWIGETYWPKSQFPGLVAIILALGFVVAAFLGVAMWERKAARKRPPPTIRRID